jgi:hypothetical protein
MDRDEVGILLQAGLGFAKLMPKIGRNLIAQERASLLQNRVT